MSKLLQQSQPSKAVGSVVRSWWAMRCQKRRRQRDAQPGGSLPVVTLFNPDGEFDNNDAYTAFDFTVDLGGNPAGMLEVWLARGAGDFVLVGTVATGAGHFSHNEGSAGETTFLYKARYVNGGVVGPFSVELEIDL